MEKKKVVLLIVIIVFVLLGLVLILGIPKKVYIKYKCRGVAEWRMESCEQNLSSECVKNGRCVD